MAVLLVGDGAAQSSGGMWSAPARELAGKISGTVGRGAVVLEFTNRSSLTAAVFATIRESVRAELAGANVHVVEQSAQPEGAAAVTVTVSQNIRELVWVAEMRRAGAEKADGEKSVALVGAALPETAAESPSSAGVQLRSALLWSQDDAILDVALQEANGQPRRMAVLGQSKITMFHMENGRWQREREFPLQPAPAWPRDPRGRLLARKGRLTAYLAGVVCSTELNGTSGLECRESDEAWPLAAEAGARTVSATFLKTRNYFSGALVLDSGGVARRAKVVPFYSAGLVQRDLLQRDLGDLWVYVALDGAMHALDGRTLDVRTLDGRTPEGRASASVPDEIWRALPTGSDLAVLHTGCGAGWHVLASGKDDVGVDDVATDELRAYEVREHSAKAVSSPLSLPGRVTALWAGAGWSGESSVLAVIRNGETGRYEAYRVLLTCGD